MDKFVFVEYLDTANNVLEKTLQKMKRIQLLCFDVCVTHIVFGASSGGIYIYRRHPCEFEKLIPSMEGPAIGVSISGDCKNLAVANASGLITILDFCSEDINYNCQIYNEHEGKTVTVLKWHGYDLYTGDHEGKVCVICPKSLLSKSIFQTPSATLMELDSSIVQIDTYLNYLLISTKTRTYLCDVEKEHYKQIGKKSRDGYYGACFSVSKACNESFLNQPKKTYTTLNNNEVFSQSFNISMPHIYCARPGARLWHANFDASVVATHQFKGVSNLKPPDYTIVTENYENIVFSECDIKTVPDEFSFGQIFILNERFILTYDASTVYIFDPIETEFVFVDQSMNNIKGISIVENYIYIWHSGLKIKILYFVSLEKLITKMLLLKEFNICAKLCNHFKGSMLNLVEKSKEISLISALKTKINNERLLRELDPIFDKIDETNKKLIQSHNASSENVSVSNQNGHHIVEVKTNEWKFEEPVEKRNLKLVFKQYKLNKTHAFDIPDVLNFYKSLDLNEFVEFIKGFLNYVKGAYSEDARPWCQNVFLNQATLRNTKELNSINDDSLKYLVDSFEDVNKCENHQYTCSCGYPLPKLKQFKLKFREIGEFLLTERRDTFNDLELLKHVPYLHKIRLLKDHSSFNIQMMIHLSDIQLFDKHINKFTFDKWDETLKLYTKFSKNFCLNCNNHVSTDLKISWNDLGLLMLKSVGPKNTIKLLQTYAKYIGKDEIKSTFFQACIFAETTSNADINHQNSNALDTVINDIVQTSGNFDTLLKRYLQKMYLKVGEVNFVAEQSLNEVCEICTLPLRNAILCDIKQILCGHKFHLYCLELRNFSCNICSKVNSN